MTKSTVSRVVWRGPKPKVRERFELCGVDGVGGVGGADLHPDEIDSPVTTNRGADRGRGSEADLGTVTDGSGYLLRHRPGWDVPIGPRAAVQLSRGFTDREIAMLAAVEQLGMVTAEQVARAFFNTHRSAYERLLLLSQKRFLVNVGADASIVRRALAHRSPPRNPVYALDWNGAYLLSYEHRHNLDNWRPSTAALITTRLGHILGVSEVWSHIMSAARASQEPGQGGQSVGYELTVAFQHERKTLLSLPPIKKEEPTRTWGRVLLQPDGAVVVGIRLRPAGATSAGDPNPPSPRWSPTLSSWRPAFMLHAPSPEVMLKSEKLAATDKACVYYRTLLLEMETGANNATDTLRKIKAYNRVIRSHLDLWVGSYGQAPRVLVVVPTDRQVDEEALKWRMHYYYKKETAVLLTSLETLAKAQRGRSNDASMDASDRGNPGQTGGMFHRTSRSAVLSHVCWLDVMVDRWKTFDEALGIKFRQ
jgi:hypothetical protein